MKDRDVRVCKKCKTQFVYKNENGIPKDIEYCSKCRGERYSNAAAKIAKALESMLRVD